MVTVGSFLKFAKDYWFVLAAAMSITGLLIGWARFRLSPLRSLEERAFKQDEYRRSSEREAFRKRMVERHLKLGDSFLDSNLLEAAEREFHQALALDATSTVAQFGLLKAEVFKPISDQTFNPMVAERRLNFILQENPDDKHALMYLGITYTTVDPTEAKRYLERALDLDPNLASAHAGLGFICDTSGDPSGAMAHYERAVQLERWNQAALNNLSYHYIRNGRFDEAVDRLELQLRLDRGAVVAYWNLATALNYLGRHGAAYQRLRELSTIIRGDDIFSHPINAAPWFFEAGSDGSGNGARFEHTSQKHLYTKLSLAL